MSLVKRTAAPQTLPGKQNVRSSQSLDTNKRSTSQKQQPPQLLSKQENSEKHQRMMKNLNNIRNNYKQQLHQKLYEKYSQSQNYYYTRDVNDLLCGTRTHFTISYRDYMTVDEDEEYLKRLYKLMEYPQKIKLLTEYYKFHQDIPRLFMIPQSGIVNHMHDKKRRIEFYRIAKIIDEENKKNPDKPPKGIVGDIPAPNTEESGMDENNSGPKEPKVIDKGLSFFLNGIDSFVNRGDNDGQNKKQKQDKNQQNNNKLQNTQKLNIFGDKGISKSTTKSQQTPKQGQSNQYYSSQTSVNNFSNQSKLTRGGASDTLMDINYRLNDILQQSFSAMHSETTIQDISDNHGLDAFLKFISKDTPQYPNYQSKKNIEIKPLDLRTQQLDSKVQAKENKTSQILLPSNSKQPLSNTQNLAQKQGNKSGQNQNDLLSSLSSNLSPQNMNFNQLNFQKQMTNGNQPVSDPILFQPQQKSVQLQIQQPQFKVNVGELGSKTARAVAAALNIQSASNRESAQQDVQESESNKSSKSPLLHRHHRTSQFTEAIDRQMSSEKSDPLWKNTQPSSPQMIRKESGNSSSSTHQNLKNTSLQSQLKQQQQAAIAAAALNNQDQGAILQRRSSGKVLSSSSTLASNGTRKTQNQLDLKLNFNQVTDRASQNNGTTSLKNSFGASQVSNKFNLLQQDNKQNNFSNQGGVSSANAIQKQNSNSNNSNSNSISKRVSTAAGEGQKTLLSHRAFQLQLQPTIHTVEDYPQTTRVNPTSFPLNLVKTNSINAISGNSNNNININININNNNNNANNNNNNININNNNDIVERQLKHFSSKNVSPLTLPLPLALSENNSKLLLSNLPSHQSTPAAQDLRMNAISNLTNSQIYQKVQSLQQISQQQPNYEQSNNKQNQQELQPQQSFKISKPKKNSITNGTQWQQASSPKEEFNFNPIIINDQGSGNNNIIQTYNNTLKYSQDVVNQQLQQQQSQQQQQQRIQKPKALSISSTRNSVSNKQFGSIGSPTNSVRSTNPSPSFQFPIGNALINNHNNYNQNANNLNNNNHNVANQNQNNKPQQQNAVLTVQQQQQRVIESIQQQQFLQLQMQSQKQTTLPNKSKNSSNQKVPEHNPISSPQAIQNNNSSASNNYKTQSSGFNLKSSNLVYAPAGNQQLQQSPQGSQTHRPQIQNQANHHRQYSSPNAIIQIENNIFDQNFSNHQAGSPGNQQDSQQQRSQFFTKHMSQHSPAHQDQSGQLKFWQPPNSNINQQQSLQFQQQQTQQQQQQLLQQSLSHKQSKSETQQSQLVPSFHLNAQTINLSQQNSQQNNSNHNNSTNKSLERKLALKQQTQASTSPHTSQVFAQSLKMFDQPINAINNNNNGPSRLAQARQSISKLPAAHSNYTTSSQVSPSSSEQHSNQQNPVKYKSISPRKQIGFSHKG